MTFPPAGPATSDVLSFDTVAREVSIPLQRYLERLTGDRATAEDLLQETLVKIDRALPRFEGRSSVKTWAFSIATRVAADHFRRPENRTQIVDLDRADERGEPPATEEDADDKLVFDEMSACVREVIDSLPEDYRAALVLHELEGLTAAQTADVLGCSLPTAKIRIHRAKRRLKAALEQACRFYHDSDDVLRCDRKG